MAKLKINLQTKKILIVAILLLFIILATWLIVDGKQDNNENEDKTDTSSLNEQDSTRLVEENKTQYIQTFLENKEYESYQRALLVTAGTYYDLNDVDSTERIIDQIIENVPEKDLIRSSYAFISNFYKEQDDKVNYEKYTQLTIEKLRQDGIEKEAELYEQQLKKYKQEND